MSDNGDTPRDRARAAVLGAIVADAATLPLHWIYDPAKIANLLAPDSDPAFFDPPSCPFYKADPGSLTCYGNEALFTLQSVAKNGAVDGAKMTADLAASFASHTGYLNKVSKHLVAAVDAGKVFPDAAAEDSQAQALVKVPIIVARYAGTPELADKVLEAVRSHQKSTLAEECACAAAAALEAVIMKGTPVAEALTVAAEGAAPEAAAALNAAMAVPHASQSDVTTAHKTFGMACNLPGCFQGTIVTLMHSVKYTDAVKANILAAGDQGGRCHVVGAFTAAASGLSCIPIDWKAKVTAMAEVEALVEKLLTDRFGAA